MNEDSKLEFRKNDGAICLDMVAFSYEEELAIWWNIEKTQACTWENVCARMKNEQKRKEKKITVVFQTPV